MLYEVITHLPNMIKHQQLIKEEWLPSGDQKLELLKLSIEKLNDGGYVYIGMDHFARPDDELRITSYNVCYTKLLRLVLDHIWQVRIVKNCQTVRMHAKHLVDRFSIGLMVLVWQAIHQIKVNAGETKASSPLHCLSGDGLRLYPIDGFLHVLVKVLDAHAATVKTNLAKRHHVISG